jgi:DNA-binding NtrC family response regulator
MARILIADQVSERRSILCTFLGGGEHVIIPVNEEEEAIRLVKEVHPELIIAEGTVSGTKLLSEAREIDHSVGMIMILSGPPTVDQVVELMNQGVSDILVSPLDINDVQTKVERALNRRPTADAVQIRFHNLVGSSPKMQQIFRSIVKAGASDSPILLVGESGTGKQLVAEQIHGLSPRKDRPFKTFNCRGLGMPELESELFGHEAGAFSWAAQRKRGQLELGDGGTLCLQEVSALSPNAQGKLLRFLEEQTVERLGGEMPLSVDVRVLTATTEPLLYKVQEGTFRSDLYYALSTCLIELPPLRARVNDIPELVEHFLGRYDVQVAGEAMEMLMNYTWPGNVDELKNAVEQAVNLCESNRIELRDLPTRVLRAVARAGRRYKFIPSVKEPNGPVS